MGIFHSTVQVRNLAPVPRYVTFDGQRKEIPVGVSDLPRVCLEYAMNQNPIMGSQDPNNPSISGARYLVVPVGSKIDRDPLTKEEWEEHLGRPCRMDEQALFEEKYAGDPKAKLISRGQKGRPAAKSRYEAGAAPQGLAEFSAKD